MTDTTLTRDEEIRQIHREYTTFYQLGGGLLLVVIGVLIGALIFADDSGYGTNIYTEILSVALTIGVLNVLQERRDTRNRIKDLQEQLVREAGSSVNATARSAIDTLRKRGWLGRKSQGDTESLLENVDLSNADLHGANLHEVNLTSTLLRGANLTSTQLIYSNSKSADLTSANLTNADLFDANLISANLQNANLTNATLVSTNLTNANLFIANLISANLQNTNLTNANLMKANLIKAYLKETNLSSANLREADITDAFIHNSTKFDKNTVLPDGSNWSEGRDLAEFGAETREIVNKNWHDDGVTITYTFADGTTRRYHHPFKGWLDDRNGNPIENNT